MFILPPNLSPLRLCCPERPHHVVQSRRNTMLRNTLPADIADDVHEDTRVPWICTKLVWRHHTGSCLPSTRKLVTSHRRRLATSWWFSGPGNILTQKDWVVTWERTFGHTKNCFGKTWVPNVTALKTWIQGGRMGPRGGAGSKQRINENYCPVTNHDRTRTMKSTIHTKPGAHPEFFLGAGGGGGADPEAIYN
jgi:hypothetical protein